MSSDFDNSGRKPPGVDKERVPEPMVMRDPAAAAAFHRAGTDDGPLVPVYELCARSMSNLLPAGGSVMDLGSGSARFLAYLAQRRPDAEMLGVELSESMLALGERMLAEEGLAGRVRLAQGDMTDCAHLVPARLDLLACMLALHQLPSELELSRALGQIAAIREQTSCAVWIADIVRLQDDRAIQEWMAQSPEQDPLFWQDARASEGAGWTSAELEQALSDAGLGDLHHCVSPLLQVHWADAPTRDRSTEESGWHDVPMSDGLRRRYIAVRVGLPGLPRPG